VGGGVRVGVEGWEREERVGGNKAAGGCKKGCGDVGKGGKDGMRGGGEVGGGGGGEGEEV